MPPHEDDVEEGHEALADGGHGLRLLEAPISLSIYLSIHPSIHLSIYLSIYLSLFFFFSPVLAPMSGLGMQASNMRRSAATDALKHPCWTLYMYMQGTSE